MSVAEGHRPVVFGEVLFDCFPDGSVVLGGAPFNVAWHLQAFGAAPLFISRVGDDPLGHRIRDTMHAWEMDASGLQLDSAHPTGKVTVSINDGEPGFEIVDQQAYDFIDASAMPPIPDAAMLYHGSLALRNASSKNSLEQLCASHAAPVFMDVNLRAPWWDRAQVRERIGLARWVKLNDAELQLLEAAGNNLEDKAASLQRACELDLVIVTRGEKGAMACGRGGRVLEITPTLSDRFVDTVGAGDAFSAVVLLGLLRTWDLGLTLERAQSFASAIVGIRGAIPQDRGFYAPFLDDWN